MSETNVDHVRINVILSEPLREKFDHWCRYGGKPKMSMNARLVDLITADAAGKIPVPRRAVKRGPKGKASKPKPPAK